MATEEMPGLSYELAEANQPRRPTLRMPLKILDPGRSKLTTVETKRIISVLDETILKVELVSTFSHVIDNLEELSPVLGPELTRALQEHQRLSNVMEATLAHLEEEGILQKGNCKGVVYGAEDPVSQLALLTQGLRGSVRNIVRQFYADPVACQAVRDLAHVRHPANSHFIKCLSDLRGSLFERLLTTPLEEKEKARFLNELSQRDKKNTEMTAALEQELAAAIQNRDDEISRKNAAIKDLKARLHNLAKCSESQVQRLRTDTEKQQKAELRGSQAKCSKLQQELNQLRAQMNALIAEDRESELALRKKKYKVEMEIENWVQKYDMEMLEKQEEIEEIEAAYMVEKEQLEELREKFVLLDQEYSQIKEERRVKQEQKEKAEKELAILVRAATLIQAVWKGYLVRSLLRSKRKKRGRGKKGVRK